MEGSGGAAAEQQRQHFLSGEVEQQPGTKAVAAGLGGEGSVPAPRQRSLRAVYVLNDSLKAKTGALHCLVRACEVQGAQLTMVNFRELDFGEMAVLDAFYDAAGRYKSFIWLTTDNMHHQWLLLAACFWVIFMFMVASKFITLTFKDPDVYGVKQEPLMLTAMTKVEKIQVPEEKCLPEEFQPTGNVFSEDPMHQPLVHVKRIELLKNVCRDAALRNLSHTTISKFVLDRIFVCDKHKILFCQTPKVGNTQWKKVLIVLNGAFSSIEEIPENIVHDHEKNGLPRLSSFSDSEIQKRLNLYFKFFIVRDPFERLISAFKDKFVHNPRFEPWYRHEIAPGIIRKYRKNRTETRGLQFEDFVRYLGDPNHRWLDVQFGDHIIHWVTYVELCAPCEITYSVIGHHETLEDDAPYILKEAGIDHLVSYPTIPPGITVYNKTKVERYFSGISKRDIRHLYARFEGDFKLFGYQEPDFLLN